MTFSRRDFLRDSAQALSAAALIGLPAIASAAKTSIEVKDVNGELQNVEFKTFPNLKDPEKAEAK